MDDYLKSFPSFAPVITILIKVICINRFLFFFFGFFFRELSIGNWLLTRLFLLELLSRSAARDDFWDFEKSFDDPFSFALKLANACLKIPTVNDMLKMKKPASVLNPLTVDRFK